MPTAETLHRLLFACGFEVVAVAGSRVVPFPPPKDGDDMGGHDPDDPGHGGPPATSELPMAARVQMLTAALDTSEAILRSR